MEDTQRGKYFDHIIPDINPENDINLCIVVRGDGNAFQAIFTTEGPFTFEDCETYHIREI